MEFFGFSSSAPNLDASFSAFPEAILKNFNQDVNPILNSTALDPESSMIQLPTLSQIISIPSIKTWGADVGLFVRNLLEELTRLSEKPLVRHVVVGIVTAAIVYGALKARASWSEDIQFDLYSPGTHGLFRRPVVVAPGKPPAQLRKKKSSNSLQVACRKAPVREKPEVIGDRKVPDYLPTETEPKVRKCNLQCKPTAVACTNTENESVPGSNIETIINSTEQFQRQLSEALGKLDEVRLKLVELENDKNLLTAEIELRKKITNRLQNENTIERDKRQQAELKMEMMEIENHQLRQVRKELLLKAGQVERLEKFLREKEEQQERLFDENVVLPRSVAQVRAKEFGELQHRLQRLESELSLSAVNVNCKGQIPPSEGPNLEGLREKNYCSHANTLENLKRSATSGSVPPIGDTHSKESKSIAQNIHPMQSSLQKTNSSDISLAATNDTAVSETGRSTRSHGKGVIAQLKAFITGNGGSDSESDVEMPADEDNYQPSDGQSSVFMSASCGSDSSGNEEVTVISNKSYSTKARTEPNRRVSRFKRRKQPQCERDVNVSKCLQENQEEEFLNEPETVASTEDTNVGSPTNTRLSPCSRTSSLHSTDLAKKESQGAQENGHTGSSEERGTESEESWTVIFTTVA